MGRKNIIYNFVALDSGDMSLASLESEVSTIAQHDTITYEASWSGGDAINGDIGIEYSRTGEPGTWKALDFGATIDTNGASGTHRMIITEVGFKYTKATYTRKNAGATGSLTIAVFASNKGG